MKYLLLKTEFRQAALSLLQVNKIDTTKYNGKAMIIDKPSPEYDVFEACHVIDDWFMPQGFEAGQHYALKESHIWAEYLGGGVGRGLDMYAKYNDGSIIMTEPSAWRKMTDHEISDAYKAMAEIMYPNLPVKLRYLDQPDKVHKLNGHGVIYRNGILNASSDPNIQILYRDGEWAQIEKVDLPNIAGYKGKDEDGYISYGCNDFEKTQITYEAIRLMKVVAERKISLSQIEQIEEYLNQNP